MRISDWSSDVCSSDLAQAPSGQIGQLWSVITGLRSSHLPIFWGPDPTSRLLGMPTARAFFSARSPRGTGQAVWHDRVRIERSEEHTSELQSLMRNSYAVFCLKKKNKYHPVKIL